MDSQLILIISLYFVFNLFEISFPAERHQGWIGKSRNILFAAVLFVSGVFALALFSIIIPYKARYLPYHGIIFSIGIIFIYIFITDFIFYWYHRAEHRFTFLWAIHELHHSDTELNVTTSMRTYWLERPIQTLLISIPIQYIVGIDRVAVIVLPILMTVWLFFTHTNVRLRLGFLTPIICGPQLHRIHHSNLPQHENKNLAQFFPVLDIIFGTYFAPHSDEFPSTGTKNLASNASISTIFLRPAKLWWNAFFNKNLTK